MPDCRYPLPDIDEIHLLVEYFNQYRGDLAMDAALHEAFARPLDGNHLSLCAVAVDSLWNAGTWYIHRPQLYHGFRDRISRFGQLAQDIARYPLPVSDQILNQNVIPTSSLLLESILDLVQDRVYYSFATKFMHWWTGTPPNDGCAAKAIRQLCNGLETNGGGPRGERIEQFASLLRVYNCWLRQLLPCDGIRRLQQFDYDTQSDCPELQCWNTPVRILDKFLWVRGGGQPSA